MSYMYVANWKMNLTFRQSLQFCKNNTEKLMHLADQAQLIICPSFVSLYPITQLLHNTHINYGAQNCSEYKSGSHTGEISAESLAEIGVRYCIVGHNERRTEQGETTQSIINKIEQLFTHAITPIICIGETKEDHKAGATNEIIEAQLKPILTSIAHNQSTQHIIIAYEPVWAIGSTIIPDIAQLTQIFDSIVTLCHRIDANNQTSLLYGGSVNPDTINQLKQIQNISGFLIGTASTSIESLEKIITL